MIYTLRIPGKLPGLNEYVEANRRSPYEGAKLKRRTEDEILLCIRKQLKGVHITKPVYLSYRWVEPNKRRDRDNVVSAQKYVQDALVKAGVLRNDGFGDIINFDHKVSVDKERPRVVVQIREANSMLNQITLIGRMVKDPEVSLSKNGTDVAKFVIAVQRNFKAANGEYETDFIPCTAWRSTAKYIGNYIAKGDLLCVSGSLEIRSNKDKEGRWQTFVNVTVDEAHGLSKSKAAADGADAPAPKPAAGFDDYAIDEAAIPF